MARTASKLKTRVYEVRCQSGHKITNIDRIRTHGRTDEALTLRPGDEIIGLGESHGLVDSVWQGSDGNWRVNLTTPMPRRVDIATASWMGFGEPIPLSDEGERRILIQNEMERMLHEVLMNGCGAYDIPLAERRQMMARALAYAVRGTGVPVNVETHPGVI